MIGRVKLARLRCKSNMVARVKPQPGQGMPSRMLKADTASLEFP